MPLKFFLQNFDYALGNNKMTKNFLKNKIDVNFHGFIIVDFFSGLGN